MSNITENVSLWYYFNRYLIKKAGNGQCFATQHAPESKMAASMEEDLDLVESDDYYAWLGLSKDVSPLNPWDHARIYCPPILWSGIKYFSKYASLWS